MGGPRPRRGARRIPARAPRRRQRENCCRSCRSPSRTGGARALARDYAAAGARGLGEVRPGERDEGRDGGPGWRSSRRGWTCRCWSTPRSRPGTTTAGRVAASRRAGCGGCLREGQLRVIAAHWGGGFPFHALMPEVRALLAGGRLAFDSAASALLYEPRVLRGGRGPRRPGAGAVGIGLPAARAGPRSRRGARGGRRSGAARGAAWRQRRALPRARLIRRGH